MDLEEFLKLNSIEVEDGKVKILDIDQIFKLKIALNALQTGKCSELGLDSLVGAPEKVGGNFNCYFNKLTSLNGAPKEVGGIFYCGRNKLTSLEGAPKINKKGFYCFNNKLTSLIGAPEKVGGSFDCSGNKLTSLQGAPEKVGGDFYCGYNKKKFTMKEVRAVCNLFKNMMVVV